MVSYNIFNLPASVQINFGKIPPGEYHISTDSRSFTEGQVYLALNGDVHDGYNFLKEILTKRPAGVIYESTPERDAEVRKYFELYSSVAFFGVSDSTVYLQQLAKLHLQAWKEVRPTKNKVIALTGSNGKTTNKEMIFHLLQAAFPGKVHATVKNFNNHIGVPKTILELKQEHQILILELGTNHPGEMKVLCDLAAPDSGYITNIGDSHLEFLKSRQGVFEEKSVLFHAIMKNASYGDFFIVNQEDPFLRTLPRLTKNVLSIGSIDADIPLNAENSSMEIMWKGRSIRLKNYRLIGKHNYQNMAMAFSLCASLFPDKTDVFTEALIQFSPSNNRSLLTDYEGRLTYLDAYNANPSSMSCAIEAFAGHLKENKKDLMTATFILGDMNELGASAPELHQKVGEQLKALGIISPVFVGRYASYYAQGLSGHCHQFQNVEELKKHWPQIIQNSSSLFLKASRTLQLESLLGIR